VAVRGHLYFAARLVLQPGYLFTTSSNYFTERENGYSLPQFKSNFGLLNPTILSGTLMSSVTTPPPMPGLMPGLPLPDIFGLKEEYSLMLPAGFFASGSVFSKANNVTAYSLSLKTCPKAK
jgi:hypothetical protein